MTQPVNLVCSRVGGQDDCSESSNHHPPHSSAQRPLETQPCGEGISLPDQNGNKTSQRQSFCPLAEQIGPHCTLEDRVSLSAFWSKHRGQAEAQSRLPDFKMGWMWHGIEEQSNIIEPSNSHYEYHALQDYQVQLMFLEQQNKRRLMMARIGLTSLPASQTAQINASYSSTQEGQQTAVANEKRSQGHRSEKTDIQPRVFPRAMRRPDLHAQKKTLQPKELLDQKSPETFHQFSQLSAELRVKIWTYASLVPRIVELYIYFPQQHTITSPTKLPATLHVCRESRHEALKHYKLSFNTQPLINPCTYPPCMKSPEIEHPINRTQTIYFNHSVDTIYVGEATWYRDLETFLTCLPSSEASKIEALAVPLRLAQRSKLECIDNLPALQELIYVTPTPHQFCILLRCRDLWFEDAASSASSSASSPSDVKKRDGRSGSEQKMKGGVADRAVRKGAWLLRRADGRERGDGRKGNFAETFWMRIAGGKGGQRHVQGDEKAWMPPERCEYCRLTGRGRLGL